MSLKEFVVLGHTHAVSGALLWLGVAPAAAAVTGTEMSPVHLAAGTLACAGAALLPDLDHPQATIAHFLGPVSQAVSRVVNLLAGGHRMATHSLLFCVFAALLVQGLLSVFGSQAAMWVLWVLIALALRGLGIAPPGKGSVVVGATIAVEAFALTWLVGAHSDGGWGFLPLAVGLGCLAHLGGDCCTPERCPLLWPSRKRYGIPLITHTGNVIEKAVIAPLMTVGVFVLAWRYALPDGVAVALPGF
jgi:membrane-bound metal-dependent hydrolase YbcI (DUF457 family)